MNSSDRKLTAVWLAVALIAASAVGGLGSGGALAVSGNVAANAAGNASITITQTAGNEVSKPTVTGTYPTVGSNNDTVRVNFSGTGADFNVDSSPPIIEDNAIIAEGNKIAVDTVSLAENNQAVDIKLSEDVPTGDNVDIQVPLRGVRNPASPGDYDVTLDLRNGSGTTVRAAGTISIVEGGDITGKVTDADTGNAITSASLDVVNDSTNSRLTGYGVDPNDASYVATVPPGTYKINVTAEDYPGTYQTVTVTNGGTATQDFTLQSGTWINGTVTDDAGNPVSGAKVIAIPGGLSGTVLKSEQTAADGSYSIAVNASRTYGLLVGTDPSSPYEVDFNQSVSLTDGQTTSVNLTAVEQPADGTIEVTVTGPNGNAVQDAPVNFRSADYKYGGKTVTDSNGVASFTRPAGSYTLRIQPSNYGPKILQSVRVNESETKSISTSLSQPATVSGTVTDANDNAASGVQVLVSDGADFYPATTNQNGKYSVTVSEGDYSVSVFSKGKTATAKQVSLSGGESATADFSLETAQVVDTDTTITSGPGDESKVKAYATLRSGILRVKLVDSATWTGSSSGGGRPDDLSSLGADRSTEFRIKLTVENFNSDSLIWGIRNGSWETQQNGSYTDIIVTGQTADMQVVFDKPQRRVGPLLFKSPQQVDWPSGKASAADDGINNAVTFGLFNLSSLPGEASSNLEGLSTTTNAQRFKPATIDNGSLDVWMAAPSKTVSGADHTGFYQANIPQAQLDKWGVDDPESELDVTYKDSSRNFTVTDTEKGARVSLQNISYSASSLEIAPNETAVDSDDDSGGGGGGSSGSDSSDDDDSDDDTPTEQLSSNTTTVTPTTQNESVVATADSVTANETIAVPVSSTADGGLNETVPVSQVNLTADDSVSNLSVTVSPTNVSSVDIPPVSAATDSVATEYVEIDASAGDDEIDSTAITITLNDSERRAIDATPENVTVYRYDNGWSALNTTHLGNGSYRATSPGFSVFAVGSESQQTSQQTSTPTPTATPTQTSTATPTETDPADSATPTDTATGTESTTDSAAESEPTTSANGPGFGPLLALLAAVAAVLLARRRQL